MAGAALRLRLRNLRVDTAYLTSPGGPVYPAVERAGAAAVAAVQAATPVRTGALRDAWAFRVTVTKTKVLADVYVKGAQGPVEQGTPAAPSQYVRFVVFGTAGPILPTPPGKILKLSDGRGYPFQSSVSGQSANPFPERALRRIRKQDFEK